MSNLEHLIENSLTAMERCDSYDGWHNHIKDDPNWDNVWVSIEDLWTICQYVIYTWCPMRCEECRDIDCVECKHRDSDVCNGCKRQWVHKDDKFELNLYIDTFGYTEGSVTALNNESTLYVDNDKSDEWERLWRWAERDRV